MVDSSCLLCNADFLDAMEQFNAKDILEADDLIENCLKSKPSKQNKKTREAFRFIIHDSLDESVETWGKSDVAEMNKPPKLFDEAIQCWACQPCFKWTLPINCKEDCFSFSCI